MRAEPGLRLAAVAAVLGGLAVGAVGGMVGYALGQEGGTNVVQMIQNSHYQLAHPVDHSFDLPVGTPVPLFGGMSLEQVRAMAAQQQAQRLAYQNQF